MKGYFKCRNCCKLLDLSINSVCTNHNINLEDINLKLNDDHPQFTLNNNQTEVICEDNHYFLIDSKLNNIQWIVDQLNKTGWTKGKIICPNCNAKIGSFNFVNILKCSCNKQILRSVHLIKSKVDFHNN